MANARKSMLGLFQDASTAAAAVGALRQAGFRQEDLEVLTGSPYPEGAFGEPRVRHRLYVFPFVGAACGLAVSLLVTIGTQLSYPLVTGGKPILSIPPMINVIYEGTMLGAIIFTVLGIIFESRLPAADAVYDPRVTDGYVGVVVSAEAGRLSPAEGIFREAGAVDVVKGPRD